MFRFQRMVNIGLRPLTGVLFIVVLEILMIRNWTFPIVRTVTGVYSQVSTTAPITDRQFAVFGCTLPETNNYNYAFYLPLTALAWHRIGFGNVVILIGRKQSWLETPVLQHIVNSLDYLNATTVFVDTPAHNAVMLSQVSRLFVSSLYSFSDEDYLLTTDSDLWPFHRELYLLPNGKKILSLNSKCCGNFEWRGLKYQMLPMANIGAKTATWRQLMGSGNSSLPKGTSSIIEYFRQAFGDVANQTVHKGGNIGWFMDQRMVSIRVTQWLEDHGRQWGQFVARDVNKDRIDRARWQLPSIASKNDTHLLMNGHKLETWNRLRPLIAQMYGAKSMEYKWCEEYAAVFRKLAGIDHA